MQGGTQENADGSLDHPMTWGFLSTSLLALGGFVGLLLGAWPLLWLPVVTPVFAYSYMRFRLQSSRGFGRFLAGYGMSLVTIEVIGIFLLATIT